MRHQNICYIILLFTCIHISTVLNYTCNSYFVSGKKNKGKNNRLHDCVVLHARGFPCDHTGLAVLGLTTRTRRPRLLTSSLALADAVVTHLEEDVGDLEQREDGEA